MNTTIRKITKEDNSSIEKIIKQVLTEHGVDKPGTAYYDSSLQHMSEFYSVSNSIYFIAELDGHIIGGAGIFPTDGLPGDTCELVKMYLLPEARGKGIGRLLIQNCLEFAQEAGYKRVYLETMSELAKAVKIYEKIGFSVLTEPLGNTGHFACTIRMIKPLH